MDYLESVGKKLKLLDYSERNPRHWRRASVGSHDEKETCSAWLVRWASFGTA